MAAFVNLFGETLVGKDKKPVSTTSALEGKNAVLVYFSAHWCGPCRGFTPELAKLYKKHTESKNFEVVFVSSDRDEKGFNEYFGEMPWLALPYSEREKKAKLSSKYGVQGIPTLVVLGSDGSLITKNGREKVSEDTEFEDFPWVPKPFSEVIGDTFVNKSFEKVGREAIEGKTLGIYFSAEWCPPCRMFTPQLASFYEEYKKLDPKFEIVFVSSDGDEESFKHYFSTEHGSYLAVPYEDRKRKDQLSSLFEVEGIPTFVVVDSSGKTLNTGARGKIASGAQAVFEKGWLPPVVGNLAEGPDAAGCDINGKPALVALLEGCDDDFQADAAKVLEPIAKKYFDEGEASGEGPKIIFFTANSESGISKRIREITKLQKPTDKPTLLLLDIPDNGAYYVRDVDDVTDEVVNGFLQDYESGKISGTRKQLG